MDSNIAYNRHVAREQNKGSVTANHTITIPKKFGLLLFCPRVCICQANNDARAKLGTKIEPKRNSKTS